MTKWRIILIVAGIFIALISFSSMSYGKELHVKPMRSGLTVLNNVTAQ